MLNAYTYLVSRIKSEKGQGMIEYALIIAFVVAIAAYLTGSGALGEAINSVFGNAKNQLSTTK